MKKLIICLATICCSILVTAQEKGEMYVGGYLGLNLGSQKTTVSSGSFSESENMPLSSLFSINAEYGYFIAKNFRLSLAVGYSITGEPNDQFNGKWFKTETNLFSVNPNISYYVKLADKFYYTPEIGVTCGWGTIKTPLSSSSTYNTPCTSLDIYANLTAFEYRVSQHFSLGCTYGYVGYGSLKGTDQEEKSETIRVDIFNFKLGTAGICARYYF